MLSLFTTLSFKTGMQIQAIVPPTSQNNYIKVHVFQLLQLHISVNMAVVKNVNSVTLVCDGDTDE